VRLELPPRLALAQLPTPIHPLDRISARWGGPRIWIKRDDETGALISGNKIRKLQYVVREALDEGADTLVTCGGIQSNHCRTTAAVARRLGLCVVLCLRGQEPGTREGNYLLDRLLGAEVRWLNPAEYANHEAILTGVAAELAHSGRRPFVIAEGASMPTAIWGYVEACREIAEQEPSLGIRFDAIVAPVGSGGTAAGLELGARVCGLRAKVWGIPVCDDEAYFRRRIAAITDEATDRFRLPVRLDPDDLGLIDGYVGGGYGINGPEELALLVDLARTEGVVLDPVYGAKAFLGLRQELAAGRFPGAQHLLYVHTGGIFGVFPKARELTAP
jgi:D-cysteine desulfhydrase